MLAETITRHKNKDSEYIVWIDVETTGTNPERDEILEIGALVTDVEGNRIGNSYEALFSISNLSTIIARTSENVQKMHENSGLWLDLWMRKTKSAETIDEEMVKWISSLCLDEERILYFGGNSITLDRNFVRLNLPVFYNLISYRSVDVTSLSIAIQSNSSVQGYEKSKNHRALSDAVDSVNEYNHYIRYINNL